MITWSDIPLGWSVIANYIPSGHIGSFSIRSNGFEGTPNIVKLRGRHPGDSFIDSVFRYKEYELDALIRKIEPYIECPKDGA